ncbi:MAG: efflux RND transporter periplasmic adaptor subunit [Bacteroides nordii]
MNKKVCRMKHMVMLSCCLAVAGCKQAPQVQMESGYEVMTVSPSDRVLSSMYSATIRGRQDIEIYPQVSGTLTKVCVTEGQRVKNGQALFIIDQVPYEAALQTALANVEAAKATLATAQLTYDSKQELYRQNVVSEFDLSTAKNSLLAAKAQLAQVKAQEVNARNNLSYTVVKTAWVGGQLIVGSVGQCHRRKATTVSTIRICSLLLSRTVVGLIAGGSKEGDWADAGMIVAERQIRLFGGRETISGVIDRSTGTVSLRAVFPNEGGLLHSGGAGNVIVPVQKAGAIVIPQAATYEIQDKVFVYKVVDGKAQSAPVQVTRVNGGKEYIVDSGLESGEVIVVEGVGLLREGTPIQPKDALQGTLK